MQYLYDLIIARPWILACWVFVVGSAIGSFLNVVIYRLPRRMSLSRPGSHCPKCSHPIRWYDNLPIAGWFLLRGKCRDCKAAISARYPLVELAIALLFVAIAYFDVYRPTVEAALDRKLHTIPLETQLGFNLLAMAAHAWAGCTLIAAVLIAWDRQRVPWPLAGATAAVLLTAPFLGMAAIWPLVAAIGAVVILRFIPLANGRP